MKTRFVVAMGLAIALSAGLILARPGLSASAAGTAQPIAVCSSGASLEPQMVAKEREELDAIKAGNLELFASLLAEDAVFVDAHGMAGKAEVVKNVAGFRLTDYTIEGVRFVPVSADSGLITYKITESGNSHGRQFTATVYIAALWAKRDGKWVCLFSQETAAQ